MSFAAQLRAGVALLTTAITLGVTAPSLAAADFAQRVDQACAAAGAQVEHLPRHVTAEVVQAEASIATKLVHQLKTFRAPTAQAERFKKFIAETQAQVADVEAALAAAKRKDETATETDLTKAAVSGRASDATAKALGLKACARDYEPEGR